MGFSSLGQEILQDRFGIDPDEFFPQDAMQQVHVAGVDAVAVVDHCEVTDTFGVQTIDRQHHVGGIHRMNQVCDDAVHLLPHVKQKIDVRKQDDKQKIDVTMPSTCFLTSI